MNYFKAMAGKAPGSLILSKTIGASGYSGSAAYCRTCSYHLPSAKLFLYRLHCQYVL